MHVITMRSPKQHILDMTESSPELLSGQDEIVYPQYLRRVPQGMICDILLIQGNENIGEEVIDHFLYASIQT